MTLEDGKYLIRIAQRHEPFIGVKPGISGPVIVDGPERVFTVHKADGNYTLSLDGRYTREDHGNVVASHVKLPPGIWSIQEQEDGLYSIEVPGNIRPGSGWTLYDLNPDAYVAVGNIGDPLQPGQLWRFVPVEE
ncbi:hypothetical protein OG21DRAFT_1501469 [Imleria badia]|nr:hypothetical protein OG21DRAFT_1501469 [Imleria badia]